MTGHYFVITVNTNHAWTTTHGFRASSGRESVHITLTDVYVFFLPLPPTRDDSFAHAQCTGWQNTPASHHKRIEAGCNTQAVTNNQCFSTRIL